MSGDGRERVERVQLITPFGTIEIAADLGRAPRSAGAFCDAVRRCPEGKVRFFRAVNRANDKGSPPIAILQAKGEADGQRTLPHETTQMTGLRHRDGTLSLARNAPGSAVPLGFFICIDDQPSLDFGGERSPDRQGFAAFGTVLSGMAIIRRIHDLPPSPSCDDPYLAGQILRDPIPISFRIPVAGAR